MTVRLLHFADVQFFQGWECEPTFPALPLEFLLRLVVLAPDTALTLLFVPIEKQTNSRSKSFNYSCSTKKCCPAATFLKSSHNTVVCAAWYFTLLSSLYMSASLLLCCWPSWLTHTLRETLLHVMKEEVRIKWIWIFTSVNGNSLGNFRFLASLKTWFMQW